MAIQHPEQIYSSFATALNSGDVPAILALFEPDAQIVPQPGQMPVEGLAAIRAVMEGFVAAQPQIVFEQTGAILAGDVAMLRSRWRLATTGPDGQVTTLTGKGVQFARRQSDGNWLLVIDDPWNSMW
jgi:uncharacterized protein (TIGR02246 family)